MFSRSNLIRNATAIIAEHGLQGLSLRSVAERAGVSLGSLSYQIGDRAALIQAVIESGHDALRAWHDQWLARLGDLPTPHGAVLASIVTAYLDSAAEEQRHLTACLAELILWVGQQPGGGPAYIPIVRENMRFWKQVLDGHADAERLTMAINAYCQDEKVFTLALRNVPEYRLLRDATVARVTAGFESSGPFSHTATFERLVAAAGVITAGVGQRVDFGTEKRAAIANWAADIIAEQGVAGLTHRAVAALGQVAPSSVAYHFGTKDELLRAGIEAQYARMTGAIAATSNHYTSPDAGRAVRAVLRSTHITALAATRDAAFIPYAIDMRRRRAENVRSRISLAISGGPNLDGAAIQAVVIAGVGFIFEADAAGLDGWALAATFNESIRILND